MGKEISVYVKNMVCPRCISAVQVILEELNIAYKAIELGEVKLDQELSGVIMEEFSSSLKKSGFELLASEKSTLISQVKTLVINQIHHTEESLKVNFSVYLSDQLNHEYSYLSRLFSSVEGVTIEKYVAKQKIEKAKELLFYNELTISEIAFQLNYSSAAHLSSQFKKETGMTPTQFKNNRKPGHHALDEV